ncbi:hypothetical protein Ancab_000689 [Ancistrocladus abbreviatus]
MSEKENCVSGGGVSECTSTRSVSSDVSEEESAVAAIAISVDLVAAARRNISFLRNVEDADWLHQTPTLLEAIRRYDEVWMPLISDLTVDSRPPMLVPPLDIEWVWFCHSLNPSYPTAYAADVCHMEAEMAKVVGPWDNARHEDAEETNKLWQTIFDHPYEKAGGRLVAEWEGDKPAKPPVYWMVSDSDVNTKYKSLQPRFLLEVCVFVRLRSETDAMQADKTREFLRLRILRCHRDLKVDKLISLLPSTSWQRLWHLYCEFGTKGITLELRHPGSLCFKGTSLLDNVSITWTDLLRATSLTIGAEVYQKVRTFTSITPPVQAPYLLKCVPDNVTDDSGAMISDVILRLNQYRPQRGRWLSRTVLDHTGRECFVVRVRVGGGFWRRGGESPEAVKWEDRIIEIREGSWSYVTGSIGKAPEKVVGVAKPKEETNETRSSWLFSTGDELTIHWESTSSMPNPDFMLTSQSSDSSVRLLKGRKMQYELISKDDNRLNRGEEVANEEEEGFVTLIRFSDDNPNGKATALLNWKLLVVEFLPEEDAVFVLLLCMAILRSVSETRKEDIGSLLVRRRFKEAKLGARDWGSVIVDPSSCSPTISSPHLQPWYWNPNAVMTHLGDDQTVRQPTSNYSLVEGGDKLYKQGIIT